MAEQRVSDGQVLDREWIQTNVLDRLPEPMLVSARSDQIQTVMNTGFTQVEELTTVREGALLATFDDRGYSLKPRGVPGQVLAIRHNSPFTPRMVNLGDESNLIPDTTLRALA